MSGWSKVNWCCFAFFLISFVGKVCSEEKGEGSGAFILVSIDGSVKFLDKEDQAKPLVGVGSICLLYTSPSPRD